MPSPFNYGFIPQTFSDSKEGGDDHPLDLVDLGQRNSKKILSVCDFVVLGSLGLIDEGAVDWKVLGMEIHEARHLGVNNLADYERACPGAIAEVSEWFKTIGTFDGKPENRYLFGGEVLGREETLNILREGHRQYKNLFNDKNRGYFLSQPKEE